MQSTIGQLREILLNEFTEAEVAAICSKLSIDYSKLPGTGVFGKTRELLAIVQRQDRLQHLHAHMRAMRPHAFAADANKAAMRGADADVDSDIEDSPRYRIEQERERADEFDGDEVDDRVDDRVDDSVEGRIDDDEIDDEIDDDDQTDEQLAEPAGRSSRNAQSARNTRSARNVARETNRTDEVVPQPRALLPLLLVAGIIILAAMIVFLPGLLRGNAAAAPSPTSLPQPSPSPTSSIPVINNPNQAVIPTPAAETQANAATPIANAGAVVIATPAPIDNTSAAAANPPSTMPVIPTQNPNTAASNGAAQEEDAAQAVRNANELLPAYYRGQAGEDQIAQFWRGKALAITTEWNAQLPKVLKLGQAPRSTLVITYDFVKEPTVTSSRASADIVTTREYWAYANPANGMQVCDTRDYTYSVLEINGRFTINAVTSRLVNKQCR